MSIDGSEPERRAPRLTVDLLRVIAMIYFAITTTVMIVVVIIELIVAFAAGEDYGYRNGPIGPSEWIPMLIAAAPVVLGILFFGISVGIVSSLEKQR